MAMIDVIMPLYNKSATVQRSIRSVQSQTLTDWRLIVIDDGSTDDSAAIVERMRAEDHRIELIRQANAGPGAARNAGIKVTTADYIAFLDADDQWYPQHLEATAAAIQKNQVAMVGTMYYEWPQQEDMAHTWKQRGVVPGTYQLNAKTTPEQAEAFVLFFHVGSCLVTAKAAKCCGGFYEGSRNGEDTFFFAKLIFNEPFTVVGGTPTARFNRQDSALSNAYGYAVPPFLLNPELLSEYCPAAMREVVRRMLARLALRTAYHKARNGFKEEAVNLINLYPQAQEFHKAYRQCQTAIRLSRILPYWVKLKCLVGPPVRLGLKKTAYFLKLKRPPSEI